jgi:hypothetical protein
MKKFVVATTIAVFLAAPGPTAWASGGYLFGSPDNPTLAGELGYSGIPRVAYMTPLGPTAAIGGEFIVDIGAFYSLANGAPGNVTIALGVPIKFVLSEDESIVVGTEFTPGLGVTFVGFGGSDLFDILLHSAIHVGYKASDQIIVGGGVEIPLTIAISTGGGGSGAAIPILFGPMVDFSLMKNLSITGDLKLGPHIVAGSGLGGTTSFGFKFAGGVAYSF